MLEYMSVIPCKGKTFCVFLVMADKDIGGMLASAANAFDGWFLADQPEHPRAAGAADVAAWLQPLTDATISVSPTLQQAFERARSALAVGDRLVVFGSFLTVAAVIPLLDAEQDRVVERTHSKGSR